MKILSENLPRNGLSYYPKDLRIMHKIQNPKTIKVEAYDEASIYIMDEEFYKICLKPKCKYLIENEICDLYGKQDKPVDRNCYIPEVIIDKSMYKYFGLKE